MNAKDSLKKFLLFEVVPFSAVPVFCGMMLISDIFLLNHLIILSLILAAFLPAVGYIAHYRSWKNEKWKWLVRLYPVAAVIAAGCLRLCTERFISAAEPKDLIFTFSYDACLALLPISIIYASVSLGCVIYCECISKKKLEEVTEKGNR